MSEYKRMCPGNCGKELIYDNASHYNDAVRKNRKCSSCGTKEAMNRPEVKALRSFILKGKPTWASTHKDEMSEKMKGNQFCLGHKVSEETKKKMSIAQIGKHGYSEEMKEKASNASKLQWQNMSEKMHKASIKAGLKIRKRPYEWVYNVLVSNSKRRGKSIELTYEEFLEFVSIHKCHYCEKEIIWAPYSTIKHQGCNLDRKNNMLGYTKDNCVVCCYQCNTVKGSHFSYDEMMLLKPALMQIQYKRKDG